MKNIIWDILFRVDKLTSADRRKIARLKEAEGYETDNRYGVLSIIFLVVGLVASALEFLIIPYLIWPVIKYAFSINLYIIGNLFIIALALLIFFIPIYIVALSRKFARMQLELNDLKIGAVMRILTLIGVILSVILCAVSGVFTFPYLIEKAVQ